MYTNRAALLAIGIGEWSAALTHLRVLNTTQHFALESVIANGEADLADLCMQWWQEVEGMPGRYVDAQNREGVVARARAWATEHLSVINDLTNEKGAGHGGTQG